MIDISPAHNRHSHSLRSGELMPGSAGSFARQLHIAQTNSGTDPWNTAAEVLEQTDYVQNNQLTEEGREAVLTQQQQLQTEYEISIPIDLAAKKVLLDIRNVPAVDGRTRTSAELEQAVTAHTDFQNALSQLRTTNTSTVKVAALETQLQSQLEDLGITREQFDTIEYGNDSSLTLKVLAEQMKDPVERLEFLNSMAAQLSTQQQEQVQASEQQARLESLKTEIGPEQWADWQTQLLGTGHSVESIIDTLNGPSIMNISRTVEQLTQARSNAEAVAAAHTEAFLSGVPQDQRNTWAAALERIDKNLQSFLYSRLMSGETLSIEAVEAVIAKLPAVKPVNRSKPGSFLPNEQYSIINKEDALVVLTKSFAETPDSSAFHVHFVDQEGETITGFQVYWHGIYQNSGTTYFDLEGDILPAEKQKVSTKVSTYLPTEMHLRDGTQMPILELLEKTDADTGTKLVSKILVSNGGTTFYELPTNGRIAEIQKALSTATNVNEFSESWGEITPAELRSGAESGYERLVQSTLDEAFAYVDNVFNQTSSHSELEALKKTLIDEYSMTFPIELQPMVKTHIRNQHHQSKHELVLSGAPLEGKLWNMELAHEDLTELQLSGVEVRSSHFMFANMQGQDLRQITIVGYGSSINGANLKDANLMDSHIDNLSMIGTQLQGANLEQSKLSALKVLNADFSNANLSGATVEDTDFSHTNLAGLKYDKDTQWSRVTFTYAQLQELGLHASINDNLHQFPASEVTVDVSGTASGLLVHGARHYSRPKADPQSLRMTTAYRNRQLEQVDFNAGDYSGFDFNRIILAGSVLQGGAFERSNFEGATLAGANLDNGHFKAAKMSHAVLVQATLRGADLESALLVRAKLQGADLSEARLVQSDLSYAELDGAHLVNTNLQGANLRGADLRSANAQGADFRGADLAEVDLRKTDLRNIKHDHTTGWAEAQLTTGQIEQLGLTEQQLAPGNATPSESSGLDIGQSPQAPTDNGPGGINSRLPAVPDNSLPSGGAPLPGIPNPQNPNGLIGNDNTQAGHGDNGNRGTTSTAVAGDTPEPNLPFQVINGEVIISGISLPDLDLSKDSLQSGDRIFGAPVGLPGLPEYTTAPRNETPPATEQNIPVADTSAEGTPQAQQQGGVTWGGLLGNDKGKTAAELGLDPSGKLPGPEKAKAPDPIPGYGEGANTQDLNQNNTRDWGGGPVTPDLAKLTSEGFPQKDKTLDDILNPEGPAGARFRFPPGNEEIPAAEYQAVVKALPALQQISVAEYSQLSSADQKNIISRAVEYQSLPADIKANTRLSQYADSGQISASQRSQMLGEQQRQNVHTTEQILSGAQNGLSDSTITLLNTRIEALQTNTAALNQQTQVLTQSNANKRSGLATSATADPVIAAVIKPDIKPDQTPPASNSIATPQINSQSAPIPRFMVIRTTNGPQLMENLPNGKTQMLPYPIPADTPITRQESDGRWSSVPDAYAIGAKNLLDTLLLQGSLKMLNGGQAISVPKAGPMTQPATGSPQVNLQLGF